MLKNIKKDDPEFQHLIAEPVTEEDFYIPAGGMMYAQTLAGYGYGGLGGPMPMLSDSPVSGNGHLTPHSPYPGYSNMPSPIAGHSPSYEAPLSAGFTSAFNNLALPSPGLPSRSNSTSNAPCPVLPATFSMWAHCSDADEIHLYTSLKHDSMDGHAQLPKLPLDLPKLAAYRFPRLPEMYQQLPCQFLHIAVPMSIARQDALLPNFDRFSTQLSLTSCSNAKLTSVTTVYSHGKRVLSLVEPLEAPRKLTRNRHRKSNAGPDSRQDGNASLLPEIPITDNEISASPISQDDVPEISFSAADAPATSQGASPAPGSTEHRFCHQAPFATDFWADFLSRNHPVHINRGRGSQQSFCKEPSERAALGMAVSGITIIQELVDANNGPAREAEGSQGSLARVSPGSSIGDVVLVVAWELECVEALGGRPGTPTVSLISEPSQRASPMMGGAGQSLALPPHQQFAGYSMGGAQHQLRSPMPSPLPFGQHSQHPASVQVNFQPPHQPRPAPPSRLQHQHQPEQQQGSPVGPTLLRKRGLSNNKPNLMLNIPSAQSTHLMNRSASPHGQASPHTLAWGMMQRNAMYGPSSPMTPAAALIGTPSMPPPLPSEEDAKAHRERLNRAWAASAGSEQRINNNGFDASPLPTSTFGALPEVRTQDNQTDETIAAVMKKFALAYSQQSTPQPQQQQSLPQHQQQNTYFDSMPTSSSATFNIARGTGVPPAPGSGSLGLSFDSDFDGSHSSNGGMLDMSMESDFLHSHDDPTHPHAHAQYKSGPQPQFIHSQSQQGPQQHHHHHQQEDHDTKDFIDDLLKKIGIQIPSVGDGQ